MYREHRELAASRAWQLRSQKRETSEFDVQLLSLLDDITNHMCELEISSNIKQVLNTCRNCYSDISCSCDDCTIKHIFSCVETPPTSPDHNSSDTTHSFNSAELLEQFKAMSKVNKIQMPKNFLKLITDKVLTKSFVQNNDGDSVNEEVKTEIVQTPKIPVTPPDTSVVNSSTTAATPTATSKVPVSTNVANSITNSTHVHNSQTTNTSSVPSSDKSGRILKEVTKSTQNKMTHCNHQYQVVKKSKEPQVCKEGCAEHGPVKNQKESKRCDCPHCEVFENSNVQATAKNNKTRDRLRIRLNEKRNKALKEKGTKNVEPKHKDQENIKVTKSGLDTPTCVNNSGEVEDTRDIKELIDFIEGTDRNAKLINAQKRLAKKARRRERKLEEERLKEEERLRIEAERLLEEQRRLEEIKRQEDARLREQQQAARNKKKNKKSKDKQNKGNHNNNNNNNNNNNSKNVKTIPVEVSQYIPPALNEKLKIHTNGSGGPMVTIKRVMEHSSSEPTVTITLKGSTPDKDKLLYTLVNGHTNLVKSVEEPLTKSQKKKAKKEQKQLLLQQQQQQQQIIENNKTLSKKERKKLKNELNKAQNQKNQQNTNNNIKIDSTNEIKKKIVSATTQNNNNSINNNNTVKTESPLNLQMLRLPPGITITKVDGPAVNRKIRINTKNESQTPTPPPIAAPMQSSDNRSGVIVVDTVKLKQVLPAAEQPPQQPQTITTTTSKKKKKKNKNKSENTNPTQNPQQNIQLAYKMPTDATAIKGSNTNGNSIVTIKNPMFYQLQESLNGKMNKQKLIENVTTTIKDARPQQASIIKGANGMVTIRSPRLNGNIPNGHTDIPVGIPDLKPVLGPNTSVYKPVKTETNKPFNAQEILSGLPGIEITKINKNSTKSKNDCKVFQPADVSIIPTNLGNGTNGDVYKLFSDNTDWTLESVFAPKDLKEDEELDADELELEAFKRFCQQSVPPERKEKVAHLNVKDIVLKKKNSNNICS